MCVLYDYRYGIFVCKCVSVSECKLCYIIYVVVQRAKRKTAVAILVPQFSYFNFHMNFSCKLSVYIYICFLCMKIENKFYSILLYSSVNHLQDISIYDIQDSVVLLLSNILPQLMLPRHIQPHNVKH